MDTKSYYNSTTGLPIELQDDRKLLQSVRRQDDWQQKAKPIPCADDFKLDIAIDGRIIKTMDNAEFMKWAKEIAYYETFMSLFDDKSMIDTTDSGAEVAL